MNQIGTKNMILLCSVITVALQLTSSPSVQPNPIYGDAGSFSFATSAYYNTGTTTVSPVSFSLTFANRSSSSTNYLFGYTIQEMNYQIVNSKINYSLVVNGSKTATSIQAALYTNNANKISTLTINYLIIEPLFASYYFDYQWIFPGVTLINTQSYSFSKTASATLNTTGGLTIWKTIVGADASLATNKQIDLYLSVTATTSTSITYKISTISPTSFFLTSIVVGCYIYDYNELNGNNRVGRFLWGSFGSVNNVAALSFTDSNKWVRTSNTMLGTNSYHIANQNFLQIKCTITPNTTVSATSSYSFNYMEFNYLILSFVYCNPASTPYLMVSTSTCYDACPIRYYPNSYSECTPCSDYRCYNCHANGSCSQCSAAVDFRVINAATLTCDPMTGYYDNGASSQALICNAVNCLTCTSNTYCLTCASGKYLTASNTCAACVTPCATCTSASACQSCVTYYYLSGSTCTINCTITNCITCAVVSSSLSCSSCVTGYYYTTGTACNSRCGDSIKVTGQACDDGNTVAGDGCSSTCTLQNGFYCVLSGSKSLCSACPNVCLTCTSSTVCQSCVTYYSLSGGTCSINCTITNCVTCTVVSSSLSCSTCVTGYAYTSGSSCHSVCGDGIKVTGQACDDGNTASGDGCSSTCALQGGFYCVMSGSKSVCSSCLSNCLSCTAGNNCQSCQTNYTFSSSQLKCLAKCVSNCTSDCGNGVREGSEKCDDGNLEGSDGCSRGCEVEQYYQCQENSDLLSTCNILNLTISKAALLKHQEDNSATLCLRLTPPNHPSYNSLNWSSVLTKPSSFNANITSLHYSTHSLALCLAFEYYSSINHNMVNFTFNFPTTVPFALLTTTTVGVAMISDNNLALNVYSSDDYALAGILRVVVRGLSFIMLLFLVVGLLRFKIVPLQASAVYQVAGFSLLALTDLSPTLSALDELSFICSGYRFTFFPQTVSLDRRFAPLGFSFNFANNYNFLGMMVVGLLSVGGVVYLVNGCLSAKRKGCEKAGSYLVWEYSFYVLMFSSYQLLISAAISLQGWSAASFVEMLTFLAGCVFVLLLLLYLVGEVVEKGIFGGADEFFKVESSLLLYPLIIAEKVLTAACLAFLVLKYQLALALLPFLLLLLAVIAKRPYSRNSGNFRPGFNYSMVIVSLCLMVSMDVFKDSYNFSIYGPLGVVGCLFATLLLNIVVYICPRKEKEVLPIANSSFGFESLSKRKLASNSSSNVLNESSSSASTGKQKEEGLEKDSYKPQDVIEKLNSSFFVQNPVIHAFRTSSRKRKTAPRRDREASAAMDDLLVIQESLAQIRNNFKERKMKRARGRRNEEQSADQQ